MISSYIKAKLQREFTIVKAFRQLAITTLLVEFSEMQFTIDLQKKKKQQQFAKLVGFVHACVAECKP